MWSRTHKIVSEDRHRRQPNGSTRRTPCCRWRDEQAGSAYGARAMRAWSLAEPLVWFNQAISYTSIVSHQEPGWDRDGFGAATGRWLRRLLDWSPI
jgi:hypothetical protein